MRFAAPLVRGTLLRREKRFFVHVRLDDGREVVAHTNNTGAMLGVCAPGSPVWLSPADDPKRKLKWTWELIEVDGVLVGINTATPNKLAREAVAAGVVAELRGYERVRTEVRYGGNSRIDLLLERGPENATERCWVEVKNVTLVRDGTARFPDSPTVRGRKHLVDLTRQVELGDRAVMLYVVQRSDVEAVGPADAVDPAYGSALREAVAAGVEAIACRADVTPEQIELRHRLPVDLKS
jgi:sugar fermentation stimulation protein A